MLVPDLLDHLRLENHDRCPVRATDDGREQSDRQEPRRRDRDLQLVSNVLSPGSTLHGLQLSRTVRPAPVHLIHALWGNSSGVEDEIAPIVRIDEQHRLTVTRELEARV